MLVRKAIVTLGCVAAIGMAGAGAASADASRYIASYPTHDQCERAAHMITPGYGDNWSCRSNNGGPYKLYVW
ncbi:hypothetical protein GCM10022420_059100 [Streptomyces iranensis]|uniref:Secreted protein n=1 Tax=Streptomyces iranensis TaxID=576784 RepID=A0ABS4MPT7_9ACTN|nr:hypothetical protein [Streptomyces iranensis]